MENIKDKINENVLLNFDDIKRIVEYYINNSDSKEYYLDTILDTHQSINAVASYNHDSKLVRIFYSNLIQYIDYMTKKENLTYDNQISYKNYQILLTILHEIRHITQFSLIYSNTTLGYILNETLPRDNNINLYRRKQYLFPLERDAEIYGDNETHNVFSKLDKIDDYVLDLMQKKEITDLTRDYGITSPFFKYCELLYDDKTIHKFMKIIDSIIKTENMDLYTRLSYGFDITKNEELLLNSIVEKYNDYLLFPRQNIKRMILDGKY